MADMESVCQILPPMLAEKAERIQKLLREKDSEDLERQTQLKELPTQSAISKCSLCGGLGSVVIKIGDDGTERWGLCQCIIRENMGKRLKFAEVPSDLRSNKINNFRLDVYKTAEGKKDAESAKNLAIAYIKNYSKYREMGKGLYFYSSTPGSGKTRMAVSIGNAINSQYQDSVRFSNTLDLLNKIKSTFSRSTFNNSSDNEIHEEHSQFDLLNAFCEIDVLILDDIGTERPTAWVEEIFYSIINGRSDNKKVTIFTSNCEVENLDFHQKIKQRIARLAMPVSFPNESVRMTLARFENETMQRELLGG